MSWLQCTKEWDIGTIDYIGNVGSFACRIVVCALHSQSRVLPVQWNERPWGPPDWTVQYRKAMNDIGFSETQIIIPDGGDVTGIEAAFAQNSEFEAAVAGLGLHCRFCVGSAASLTSCVFLTCISSPRPMPPHRTFRDH